MKNNNQKGITLIALIITIIVLLILAGIVLMSLSGENGILTRATETSKKWGSAQEYEREEMLTLEAKILEQELDVDVETDQEQGSKNEMIAYELDGVPIPKGFTYLEGTRETGLVIMNKKDKNEFVWIPADANELKEKNEGNYFYDETLYPESYRTIESVQFYGGYYMARYSAGADVEITSKDQVETIYSQPNKFRYNCANVLKMVELCATMYPNDESNKTGTISTFPLDGMYICGVNWYDWCKEEPSEINEWVAMAKEIDENYSIISSVLIDMDGNVTRDEWFWYFSVPKKYVTLTQHINTNYFSLNINFRPVLYIKIPEIG